ncbi:MAG: tRNA adenylyltransferase, partial [Planctomycetaceae bacterium]
ALEHALQVFDLVHAERPYDEELLTAALVQEVGLALDRDRAVAAGLEAVGDLVTPRTRWLVESVAAARAHREGTLGHRARSRLEAHPDFEAVLLLAEADRKGRVRGGAAPTLDEALAILRELDAADGDPA